MYRMGSFIILWMLIVSCTPQPQAVVEVTVDPTENLRDSLETLLVQKAALEEVMNQSIAEFKLRSVRDIEFYEFVFDHAVLSQGLPNGQRGILADTALLYSGPNPDDSVIEKLPFKTTFIWQETQGDRAKIRRYSPGPEGYVDVKDIYTYATTFSRDHVQVMMGQTTSSLDEKSVLRVVLSKYRRTEKIAVFEVPLEYSTCKVFGMGTPLEDDVPIFGLVQSTDQIEVVDFYQYHEGAFTSMLRKENRRLKDGYEYSSVYFPQKYRNGEIKHVLSGPFENALNMATGSANVFEVPDSIDIALESLVIVHLEKGSMVKGNPGYEPLEGVNEMVLIESTKTDYYYWNGKALSLYASVSSKNEAE